MSETIDKFNTLLRKTAAAVPPTATPAGLSNDAPPTETPKVPQPAFDPNGSHFSAAGNTNDPQPAVSRVNTVNTLPGLRDLQKTDPIKAHEIRDGLLTATTGAEGLVAPQATVTPAGGLKTYGHGGIPGMGQFNKDSADMAALNAYDKKPMTVAENQRGAESFAQQQYHETPEQRKARHAQEELAIQAKQNAPKDQPGVFGQNYSVVNSALGLGNYLSDGMGTKWQEWYKNNPVIGNALGLGVAGLGAAGIAGLMSSAFSGDDDDEEDDRPRRRRRGGGGGLGKVLPWALGLGGLAAGGYALWKNKDAIFSSVAGAAGLPPAIANQTPEKAMMIINSIKAMVEKGALTPEKGKQYEDAYRNAKTQEEVNAISNKIAGETGVKMTTDYVLDHPWETAKQVGTNIVNRGKAALKNFSLSNNVDWSKLREERRAAAGQAQSIPKTSSMTTADAVGLGATTLGGAGAGYLVNRYLLGNKSKTSAILSALTGAGVGALGYTVAANASAKQIAANRANNVISTGNADIRLSKDTPKDVEETLNSIKNGTFQGTEEQAIDFLDNNAKYFISDYEPTGITTGWTGKRAVIDTLLAAPAAYGGAKFVDSRVAAHDARIKSADAIINNPAGVKPADLHRAQANKAFSAQASTRWNSTPRRYAASGIAAAAGATLGELYNAWASRARIDDQKDVYKKSIYPGWK